MKRMSIGDRAVTIVNYIFCFIAACITAYPLIYVFSMSISDPTAVISNSIKLFPKGFSLAAYKTAVIFGVRITIRLFTLWAVRLLVLHSHCWLLIRCRASSFFCESHFRFSF